MILINLKVWFWKFLKNCDRYLAQFLCWFIVQARPLFGPPAICPFKIGCTQFAIMQLEQNHVPVALWHTTYRVLRCNPIWLWWNQDSQISLINFSLKKARAFIRVISGN